MDRLYLAFQEALAGRYSIDREVGRGGMGIVYLAREIHLDRLVAIKLLPPERAADPAVRERFLREVRLAARLSHPNIIPIHSVEERDDFVFYVMAFIDGETLTERVLRRGPLSGSEGARVLREVSWALAYAHEQGFVHRDVKPDNILIERSSNRVLVADFGIAAALGNTSADGISGTPELMSPEQVLGGTLDGRTDIYGLGATGFFAFSGRYPFEGRSATEILAKQVSNPAPPLSSLGLSVPRKLATVVDRCLAKSPDERPATANAVAEQLTLALEQRRDVPAALRAFVKRGARLDGSGTLVTAIGLLPVSIISGMAAGSTAGFAVLLGLSGLLPVAYMTTAARRLLLQGFSHRDLPTAFRNEAEHNEEEKLIESGLSSRIIERLARAAAITFGVTASVSLVLMTVVPDAIESGWNSVFGVSLFGGTVAGLGYGALSERRQDVDTKFWGRLWLGPIGRAAFRLASRTTGSRAATTAMTHRATELSLGLAAEQLFERLPRETRKALAEVPAVVERLQADAQRLRAEHEQLQGYVASSSAPDPELAALRDAVHARLGDAVGALETIRLDLLRLHAGATSVGAVTTHLGHAAEVSEEIARLVSANREVDRMLHYPRAATPTPA